MKKIKKIQLHHSSILAKEQMKSVVGGLGNKSYHYYLRCDQDSPHGFEVDDCERTTMQQHCSSIPPYPVCVITYY